MYRLSLALALCCAAPLYADEPKPDTVSKGEVTSHTFDKSKIFPGTVREYSIYVPAQYDPSKPACVHVNQDGIQFNAPAVFDELIHKKEMPITIGVFIRPGVVKATSSNALDRFNRSFEYDGLGDSYARFLLEEMLPEVEKQKTKDGRPIKLSKDGNDRSIAGSSSGAICAFTAAWERPDAFRRVFSAIGTYVGLRGGNNYPTLLRKYEPRPIRIFLQDGSADNNAYGGDWWMANQEMQRSLAFAGYEVKHEWGEGGHNGQHATKLFPDAMRWLWKDWPAPVKAGAGSQQLKEILLPGEDWKLVADGYRFTEGPTANAQGEVFYNDVPGSKTYRVGLEGKVEVFLPETKKGDGQRFGPDGRLYSVAGGTEQILAYDSDGKATVIADGFRRLVSWLRIGRITIRSNLCPVWEASTMSDPEFKSPPGRLARLFRRSRDTWKQRAADKQAALKQLRITVRDVSESRDHWKTIARQQSQEIATLRAQLEQVREQPSAGGF